jgi:putative transposase
MSRSRYVITEADKPHFLTCTVMEWLPVFMRPACVDIVLSSWQHLQQHEAFELYGYVIMENHLHFVAQAPRLDKCVSSFKSFTAKNLLCYLEEQNASRLLERLRFSCKAHKHDRQYQFWQEGSHAELIFSEDMMREKLDYIHNNPVKRGYVDKPEHWRYSSARNYMGEAGLIEVNGWA